ncbi:MAG: hypothetical protein U0941_12570 [Planctomycetaceae bacterium]
MEWNLIPFEGISSDLSKIMLGQSRTLVRKSMATAFGKPVPDSDYPDEDDFVTPDHTTFIRVRYQGKVVRDIEFLSGCLRYNGVELHDGTTLRKVRQFLKSISATLRPTEWLGDGFDCVALGVNIASHDQVGGDGDGVEWVIMSSNFKDADPGDATDGGGLMNRELAMKLFQMASQGARGTRQKLLDGVKDRDPLVRHVSAIELARKWPKELTEASIRELLETLARDQYGEPSPFDDDYTEVTTPHDEDEDGGELGQDIVVAFSHLNCGQAGFVIPRLLEFWSFGCEFYELGDAMLALSFPTSDSAVDSNSLSGLQENVLEALIAQPRIWENHSSWKNTLARYGLPRTLAKMRKFLGYR